MTWLLLFSALAFAQEETPEPPEDPPLSVGVLHVPPFAVHEDGHWRGLTVDLWEGVAEDLSLEYRFIQQPDLRTLLQEMDDGALDVGLGALTITAAREDRFDFTHAFYSAGLGIASEYSPGAAVMEVVDRVVSARFLRAVLGLLTVLMIGGAVMWVLERRHNEEEFGGKPADGLLAGLWWSAATLTTVGYGDKAPRTRKGQLVGIVWMFVGIVTLSSLTANLTSALTLSQGGVRYERPDQLRSATVACVTASTSCDWLVAHGVAIAEFDTVPQTVDALADGEVDAVVHDAPLLRYALQLRGDDGLGVSEETFHAQLYGVALAAGSPLRDPINSALLRRVDSDGWDEQIKLYFGQGSW